MAMVTEKGSETEKVRGSVMELGKGLGLVTVWVMELVTFLPHRHHLLVGCSY
jgi:hypothetical protein